MIFRTQLESTCCLQASMLIRQLNNLGPRSAQSTPSPLAPSSSPALYPGHYPPRPPQHCPHSNRWPTLAPPHQTTSPPGPGSPAHQVPRPYPRGRSQSRRPHPARTAPARSPPMQRGPPPWSWALSLPDPCQWQSLLLLERRRRIPACRPPWKVNPRGTKMMRMALALLVSTCRPRAMRPPCPDGPRRASETTRGPCPSPCCEPLPRARRASGTSGPGCRRVLGLWWRVSGFVLSAFDFVFLRVSEARLVKDIICRFETGLPDCLPGPWKFMRDNTGTCVSRSPLAQPCQGSESSSGTRCILRTGVQCGTFTKRETGIQRAGGVN